MLGDSDGLTCLQVMSLADGFERFAQPRRARILRSVNSSIAGTEISIDLKKILDGKATDFQLRPNDVLIVPTNGSKAAAARALRKPLLLWVRPAPQDGICRASWKMDATGAPEVCRKHAPVSNSLETRLFPSRVAPDSGVRASGCNGRQLPTTLVSALVGTLASDVCGLTRPCLPPSPSICAPYVPVPIIESPGCAKSAIKIIHSNM